MSSLRKQSGLCLRSGTLARIQAKETQKSISFAGTFIFVYMHETAGIVYLAAFLLKRFELFILTLFCIYLIVFKFGVLKPSDIDFHTAIELI